MTRRIARRRRGAAPLVEPLEGRHLLSTARLPPGHAAEVVAQSYRNARPAPQSPSPATTRVSVATDRPSYAPGDPVHLTLTQAVAGNTPVNTGPMGNYDVVVSQRGRELWRLSEARGPAVASHVLVTMQPGESRQATVTWNGRARDGSVVAGPVEVRAVVDRVESPPRTVQIGAGPQQARPSSPPTRPQATGSASRPVASSADAARARQLREQQARQAAEARLRAAPPPQRRPGLDPIAARRPVRG